MGATVGGSRASEEYREAAVEILAIGIALLAALVVPAIVMDVRARGAGPGRRRPVLDVTGSDGSGVQVTERAVEGP
jgi:hypothetical protein